MYIIYFYSVNIFSVCYYRCVASYSYRSILEYAEAINVICNSATERGERERREREREWEKRFRRVIGSAGVDAILSSIPHQPPPGNLYPPAVLSFSRVHHHPISYPRPTRDRGEYQAAVSFDDRNRRKLVNDSTRAANGF